MNIHELDSYNLADAVKFHRRLNPKIWGRDEHLLPEVRDKLLAIAADFQEFLGVDDLNAQDITISGSNAAYSYTKNSDIDLHLVVEMPADPVYQELFNAKKYQYNDEHNIKIGGADVELYVQPADQAHHSQGIYSVRDNEWRQIPQRKRARIDDACVRDKVADLDARIHAAIKSRNLEAIGTLWNKIKAMRSAGLEQHGEFGCENIAFKMLRNKGCIAALKDAKNALQDLELSLHETPAKPFRYGYGSEVDEASWADMRSAFAAYDKPQKQEVFRSHDEYKKVKKQREAEREEKIKQITRTPVKPWSGGVEEGMQSQPYSTSDGVAASTKEFLEDVGTDNNLVHKFIQHTAMELGIDPLPEIHLHTNPEWSTHNHSFGRYNPDSHTLNVSMPNRHVLDVLRTVAHELVHCSQNQQHGHLPDDAGETGSRWENDANARAGIIMRDWANSHPEHFELPALGEGASGYIPKNRREAARPQYAMALSVDIKPGQTGKEANKLALNTGRNGEPGLLMKTVNLREYRMPQPSQGPGQYRDLNEPLGPESPPKMPAGTIKVDVSDMYDWYKLGQKISDLNSIKPGELGSGPPSTVFAFGSEDLENMYSHELMRLGLKTHDLDEPGEEDIDEDLSRRGFLRGVGAAAGIAATGAGAKELRDYEPKQMSNITQIVDAPDVFASETQQLLHDKYVYNRLTKDAFLQMRADPDFASMVEYEQVFSKPMNSKVTLMFNNKNDRGYWVTPAVFDAISKEMAADQMLARNKRPGGVPMAKDPMATDKLPNSMRQSQPPTPGEEQDRAYRRIGASQPAESIQEFSDTSLDEDDLEEGWKSALAGAAATAAMAFTPAPANSTATPTVDPSAQPAAVQQSPGAAAESALSRIAQAAGIKGVELAQFLAQCAHETGDFAHLEELGGNRYLAKYDPSVNPAKARALGNTEAGDGAKYKGRGFIQITGKANYATAGQALGIDLVNNPELAAKPDVAAKIAVWYWQNRVAPYVQDFSDTRGVTKRINPGLQGLQDRQSNFKDYQQQVASVAQPKVAV